MTGPNACAVTVVEAHGGAILAKRWHADGTATPYDNARTVTLHALPVADLAGLHDLLRELLTAPRCCIVRGAPIDPARVSGVRRLLHRCPETGDAPTLREVPRRWVAVDLDGIPLPAGVDPLDVAACARVVRPALPHAFRDAAAIVGATASHGMKPGARLRWWAWLSRPTTGAELETWFAGCPVDLCTFRAVQPIYTAAPLFAPAMTDPLPARLVLLPGAREVVTVPHAALLRPVRVVRAVPASAGGDASGRFAALVRTVRHAPEGQRHHVLFWAACRAGEMIREGGGIGDGAAADALAAAAIEGGGKDRKNAEATARGGIARGRGN